MTSLVNQPLQEMPERKTGARHLWSLGVTLLPAAGAAIYLLAMARGIVALDTISALVVAATGVAAVAASYLTHRSHAEMAKTGRHFEAAWQAARAPIMLACSAHSTFCPNPPSCSTPTTASSCGTGSMASIRISRRVTAMAACGRA